MGRARALTTTLIYDQGHLLAFPTDPDHPRPLILDAMGATLSPLQLRESLKNVGPELGPEGAESEEVSELPLEEAEVSERPSEGALGERSEWKEHAVVLGTAGRGLEMEVLQSISGTQRQLESKEYQRCPRSELEKL